MDRERLVRLAAEMRAQLRLIERVSDRLNARVKAGLDTPGQLDSIALQIHYLYCSVADLLKSFFTRANRVRG